MKMKFDEIVKLKYNIELEKVIPGELTNTKTGDHLYMIGSAYYKRHPSTKRIRFHQPTFFLVLIAIIFCRSVLVLFLPRRYDDLLIWIGDISHIVSLRKHFNILLITFDYIIYFVHILHYLVYYRYRKYSILPNHTPFDLVAGIITPKEAGLYNKRKVVVYARFVKSSLSFCHFLTRYFMNIFVFSAFFMVFLLKITKINSLVLYLVCALHTVVWTLKSHIFFTYLFYHMLYFYIICFYLRLKISTIQMSIWKLQSNMYKPIERNLRTYHLIVALKKMSTEIKQFNSTFWSRFIFSIWSGFSVNISIFLYTTLYAKIDIIVRMICWLVLLLEIFSVAALCLIASSVNSKSRRLYFSLNSCFLSMNHIKLRIRLKLSTWTETWSSRNIGFSCWNLFPLNYFTFYEMVAIVATMFLKLVQIKLQ